MTTTYSKESLDALSWLMSASVHYFMDYGGYFPTDATTIFEAITSIEDASFIETLSGDLGEDPNNLRGFSLLEDSEYLLKQDDQLLSRIETDAFIFSLVSTRHPDIDDARLRTIYILIK